METKKFSLLSVTGKGIGNVYQNGTCIHEVGETLRENGNMLKTVWYCIVFGTVCDFDPEIGNCAKQNYTPHKKISEPEPTFGVRSNSLSRKK